MIQPRMESGQRFKVSSKILENVLAILFETSFIEQAFEMENKWTFNSGLIFIMRFTFLISSTVIVMVWTIFFILFMLTIIFTK
jgi:hypothetical protein